MDELAIERHGTGFFEKAVSDTLQRISPDDREIFLQWFTRKNLLREIETGGVSTNTCRLVDRDSSIHVSMKATRMQGSNRIILGVSIVDFRA